MPPKQDKNASKVKATNDTKDSKDTKDASKKGKNVKEEKGKTAPVDPKDKGKTKASKEEEKPVEEKPKKLWTGKTPATQFHEWCQRNQRSKPEYVQVSQNEKGFIFEINTEFKVSHKLHYR